MNRRVLRLCSVGLISMLALLAATTASAETALRAQVLGVNSGADALGFGVDYGSGPGVYLGVEMKLNERYGIEIGAAWSEFEQSTRQDLIFVTFDVKSSLRMVPVTVALDIHLTPSARNDFYIAPKIGYAFFDDLELETSIDFGGFPIPGIPGIPGGVIISSELNGPVSTRVGVEDQLIYGLRLGYDIPLGDQDSWMFSSSIDYTAVDLELENAGGASVGLDPLSIGLGLTLRF